MTGWNVILNDEEDAFFETKVLNGWIEYAIEIVGIDNTRKYGVSFNMIHQFFAFSDMYTHLANKYPDLLKAVYLDAKERILNKIKLKNACH